MAEAVKSVDAAQAALLTRLAESHKPLVATLLAEDAALTSTPEAYLKLHLLSHRLVKPHGLSLAGVFPLLPNVAWTSQGAIDLSELAERQLEAEWVLVVSSTPLDMQRFIGKRVFQSSPAQALQDVEAVLLRGVNEAQVYTAPSVEAEVIEQARAPKIVAVTACPTGVAHTFMAAEALQQAAKRLGYDLQVETQGSVGARNPLSAQAISDADVVLLAADIEVPTERFAGKKIYRCGTGIALKQAEATLKKALAEGRQESAATGGAAPAKQEKTGVYKHLLTGVSFMLPMVVAGGLLIALSFVFGITAYKEPGTLAAALMQIGGDAAFKLMVPLLAGYIAYSIADRPGLAPGMIGGLLASTLGAGFIGGIIAGFIAGYCAKAINRYARLPQSLEALKPILIIPLFASLFTGLVMIYVVGKPVAGMLEGLTHFLDSMGTTNAILLGVLLGGMMCVDLGGPINKAAYAFSVGLLASQSYAPMAATMAAALEQATGIRLDADTDVSSPAAMLDALRAKVAEQLRAEDEAEAQAALPRPAKISARAARHEAEEAKLKQSVREIFRKLASALHPDREPDPAERARKTDLMQRANAAYAANDLLGLLELQLAVEQIDQAGLDQLDETKTKQYNKILGGQIHDVKAELDAMEYGLSLEMGWEFYHRPTLKGMLATVRADIARAQRQVSIIEADLASLHDIKKLKAWLKPYRIAPPESDDFFY